MTPLPPGFWSEQERQLVDLFAPSIVRAMLTGASTAGDELIDAGIEVDWSLVDNGVKRAAKEFVENVAQTVTKTNLNAFTVEFAEWLDSGEPLPALTERLAQYYGPVRSEMIAVTETTRAFAEANRITWRQNNVKKFRFNTVVDDRVCPICEPHNGEIFDIENTDMSPPLHVRCRCYNSPVIENNDD